MNNDTKSKTYLPLLLILAYLLGFVLLRAVFENASFEILMNTFMGGFFAVFSFFKFLDLKGFAKSYRTYDILAKRSVAYAYAYPFIELTLGVLYLSNLFSLQTNIATAIVMAISSAGVLKSILSKNQIRCACLGTVFNLPMSTITLIEDLLMFAMAVLMIAI